MKVLLAEHISDVVVTSKGKYLVVETLVTQNDDIPGRGILPAGSRGLVTKTDLGSKNVWVLFPHIPGDIRQVESGSYRLYKGMEQLRPIGRVNW